MNYNSRKIFYLFLYLSLTTSLIADQIPLKKNIEINIIAPEITDLIKEDGSSVYQLLVKEAAKRSNITIIDHFVPQRRVF